MKFRTLPLAAALIFSPAPAMAQDLSNIFGPGPNPIAIFKELFKAEPLTAAEEARLPAAQQLANSLMPPGSYGTAFSESFSPMATKVMALVEPDNATKAANLTGLSKSDVEALDDAKLAGIVTLLDPQAAQRNQQMADFVFVEIAAALVKIEPMYRDGLARAYAKRFDAAQLAEINAFFATPTGSRFAATSMAAMYFDPQLMAKTPDMIPPLVGHAAEAAARFVMTMDTIPQARQVSALSSRERSQMLNLLGLTDTEYEGRVAAEAVQFDWTDEETYEDTWPIEEVPLEGGLEEVE